MLRLRRHRTTFLSVLGLVGLVAAGLSAPLMATAATKDGWIKPISSKSPGVSNLCTQYLFVAVRGSAEHSELGNTLDKVRSNLEARMDADGANKVSVRTVYIDYPAASTNWLLAGGLGTPTTPSVYSASITAGQAALSRVLQDSSKRCAKSTNEKWILAGYSQGAQVVNRVLGGVDSSTLTRVAGVALIGDPGNYPGKPRVLVGNKPNTQGRGAIDWASYRVKAPASLRSKTYSLCSGGDLVCDTKVAFRSNAARKRGLAIHSDYKSDPHLAAYFRPLADLIARSAPRSTPAPTSSPTPTPTPTASSSSYVNIPNAPLKKCLVGSYNAQVVVPGGGQYVTELTAAQEARITSLYCPSDLYTITDLTGLEFATGLTSLRISGLYGNGYTANAASLSPIANLHSLTSVELNGVVDHLQALTGLTNLRSLNITGGADLTPLASMDFLRTLYVSDGYNSYISNVEKLSTLRSLTDLHVTSRNLLDLRPFAVMTNTKLDLDPWVADTEYLDTPTTLPTVIAPDGRTVSFSFDPQTTSTATGPIVGGTIKWATTGVGYLVGGVTGAWGSVTASAHYDVFSR